MKTRCGHMGFAVLLLACAAVPGAAWARSKGEVLGGIKARYPALTQLLAAKTVGETCQGIIEAVKSQSLQDKVQAGGKTITVAQFISQENGDRTEYFAIAAKETNTSPDVVAKNFGIHRQSLLKAGEFWKGGDGKWVEKK